MPILLESLPPALRKQVMAQYGIKEPKKKRWNSGRAEDLCGIFMRSAWERNWGRYLEWQKRQGLIAGWEYEPKRFDFPIKRGTNSYLPDFKVWKTKCEYEWHEIKGWRKPRGMTALKRMAKYYPGEKIIVIDAARYREIARQVSGLIPYWEHGQPA